MHIQLSEKVEIKDLKTKPKYERSKIQNQKDPKAKIRNPLTAPPLYAIEASWSG